jgi:hypothetical protein
VPGALCYLRLHEEPASRDAILTVIRARVIPWMPARHGLPGVFRRIDPAAMRRVPVFADD